MIWTGQFPRHLKLKKHCCLSDPVVQVDSFFLDVIKTKADSSAGEVGGAGRRVLPLGRLRLGFSLDPHYLGHDPLKHGQEGIGLRDELL